MAAITICSDFGAQKNKVWHSPLFPHLFLMKWWDQMPWSLFSECWAISQLFHYPLSLSSRDFLVPLHFCHKGGVICIPEVIDISPGNLDSSLCVFQPSVSHDSLTIFKLRKISCISYLVLESFQGYEFIEASASWLYSCISHFWMTHKNWWKRMIKKIIKQL